MDRGNEQTLLWRRQIVFNRLMKKCSLSFIIREIKIKTIKCHLIPVWLAHIKKNQALSVLVGMWWKKNSHHCRWECCRVRSFCKALGTCLRKVRIELLYDPAIPLSDINLQNTDTFIQKDIYTIMHCITKQYS